MAATKTNDTEHTRRPAANVSPAANGALPPAPFAHDDEVIDLGDSPPTPPDAELWLEVGRKWVTEGPASLRNAATALLTGLGALQGIYLGILGFAKFIPDDASVQTKVLYAVPLLPWMISVYLCLQVLMTSLSEINLNAPSDIRARYVEMIEEKQRRLEIALWWLFGGLIAAAVLVVFRLRI